MKHTHKYFKGLFRILPVFILLALVPIPGQAQENGRAAASVKDRDSISPALFSSVPAVMAGLKEKRIHLIDVRPESEFNAYHIPGAIHIDRYAIKTKPFLKHKPVVLVNKGFEMRPLAETCNELKSAGFHATMLAGGLVAWKAMGGQLAGDPFDMQQLSRISPQALSRESGSGHYTVVDASSEKGNHGQPELNKALAIDFLKDADGVKKLNAVIRKNSSSDFKVLVILADSEKQNNLIQRKLSNAGIHNIFFLQGGTTAYQNYQKDMALSARPKEARQISTAGCRSCVQ